MAHIVAIFTGSHSSVLGREMLMRSKRNDVYQIASNCVASSKTIESLEFGRAHENCGDSISNGPGPSKMAEEMAEEEKAEEEVKEEEQEQEQEEKKEE